MARTVRNGRRCGGVRSKAHKLIALCMGGVLLFSSGQAVANESREGFLRQNQEEAGSTPTMTGPEIAGQVATCTLSGGVAAGRGGSDANNTLTLSKDHLTATVKCSGENNAFVPTEETNVCSVTGNTDTLADCKGKESDSNGKQTTLDSLLGATRGIKWKKTNEIDNQGETMMLELQGSDLPFCDKSFFVGCDRSAAGKAGQANDSECKVNVIVQARPSSVDDENIVTCAYGKDSNPQPLKVEMTTEKNTLTLRCGSEASIKPESYQTQFCDPQEDLANCTVRKFADILPNFVESWWTAENGEGPVKLTIPEMGFPESEQQFRLVCVPTKEDPPASSLLEQSDETEGAVTAAATSTCNVIVTVKSGSSASSAGQVIATVSGAAALVGLLVGSL
uniref:SAG-related sequence SRS15A n=1 Tax=Toxoplasma gondii COUG TaxID=1074873 RepID=A0A2G8Y2F5_TOXGO|nr:SAG-related sequence SRS15A [Toxoplasma gondii COUG]